MLFTVLSLEAVILVGVCFPLSARDSIWMGDSWKNRSFELLFPKFANVMFVFKTKIDKNRRAYEYKPLVQTTIPLLFAFTMLICTGLPTMSVDSMKDGKISLNPRILVVDSILFFFSTEPQLRIVIDVFWLFFLSTFRYIFVFFRLPLTSTLWKYKQFFPFGTTSTYSLCLFFFSRLDGVHTTSILGRCFGFCDALFLVGKATLFFRTKNSQANTTRKSAALLHSLFSTVIRYSFSFAFSFLSQVYF